MGAAVDGYCHADVAAAVVAVASRVGVSVGGDSVLSGVASSGGAITYTYTVVGSGASRDYTVTPASCSDVGPLPSGGMGLTLADASALAFAVVGAWVAAYAVVVLRRGLIG